MAIINKIKENEKTLKKLQEYGFKIGSVNITTKFNSNCDGIVKISKFPNFTGSKSPETKDFSWTENEPKIFKGYNSYYLRTGEYNNIVVLDLDDMNNKECQDMYKMAQPAGIHVKTNKGYHFYFKYEDDLPTKHGKQSLNIPFDLQSNNAYVYCPPSSYESIADNTTKHYELIKSDPIEKMPIDLKAYILKRIGTTITTSPTNKYINNNNTSKYIDNNTDDILIKLINGLNKERSTDFNNWLTALFAFKSDNIDVSYFHYFSKLHYDKYDHMDCEKKYNETKPRNKEQKRATMATIWFWLKEDNKELFNTLIKEKYADNLKIDLDKYKKFNTNEFMELVDDDKKHMGKFYEICFNQSKSFQYFNKFHFYHSIHKRLYKYSITDDSPIPYAINGYAFPNILINKDIHFEDLYEKQTEMKLIEKFIFEPNPEHKNNENEINLFNGFKYSKTEVTKDIDPFINHIKSILNNNEEEYNYMLNWFAHIFQYPHRKTIVALILYSDTEGTGKNIISNTIGKLFGKYYYHMQSGTEFDKRFNSSFENKLFIVGDEINARMKDDANELKNVIANEKITIEHKGIDPTPMQDYCNFFFTTNNENVFKISLKDRRLMIYHCKEERLKTQTVKEILKIQESDNLLSQLYTYFMTRDISNFDPREMPITEYKKDLIKMDLPAYFGMMLNEIEIHTNIELTASDLYKLSIEYAKRNNMVRTYTERKFSMDFKKVFGSYYKRKAGNRFYIFESSNTLKDDINNLIENYINNESKLNYN